MIGVERFWAKVDKTEGCWEWTGCLNGDGYGNYRLKNRLMFSHRYSYIIHHPLTIDLLEHREIYVLHKCDNPKCVNPSHLFLGSQSDNMRDMTAKGRGIQMNGERHHKTTLTEAQVQEIRGRWLSGGITQLKLANEYRVSKATLNKIILRKTWKHIID
jgi:hypothetical protein